ncbi:hypothetical protein BKA63DRAFT_564943 [Paraphoma chrysanthemicola]|nr:hypothetical protein BKA63DRAFT_564943 [Paraphoma chrysanthemicola]
MDSLLRFSHLISSDVLTEVYDWVFAHEVFTAWRNARTTWQLHCIGGPGAGKTTLTALISRHLKSHPSTKEFPIVSVFITSDVPNYQTSIVEDFLETVYLRLAENGNLEDDQSDDLYDDFELARTTIPEGPRRQVRLELIRSALHMRLEALRKSRSFLLLDGLDRIDTTLRILLEEEIFKLHRAGVSVLLTSRLAIFEQDVGICDHNSHGGAPEDDPLALEDREPSDLFLLCQTCNDILCVDCRDADRQCGKCGHNNDLHEPYNHVNIRLSIPDHAMKNFIACSLENEHGDLNLGSSTPKPPLSPLGRSLASGKALKSIQKHADDILEYSYGHIGIAKARLDMLHEMDSIDQLEMRRDELPASIIMIFNACLRKIETQHSSHRDMALTALAASAGFDDGIEIPDLREQLGNIGITGVRSGEEILEATQGLLIATTRDNPQKLTVYNQNLVYYIEQKYHRAIHRASIQLRAPKARFEPQNVSDTPTAITPYKLSRSVTGLQQIPEHMNQPFIIRKGTRQWA